MRLPGSLGCRAMLESWKPCLREYEHSSLYAQVISGILPCASPSFSPLLSPWLSLFFCGNNGGIDLFFFPFLTFLESFPFPSNRTLQFVTRQFP